MFRLLSLPPMIASQEDAITREYLQSVAPDSAAYFYERRARYAYLAIVVAVLLRDINRATRLEFTSDEEASIKRITKTLMDIKAYQDEKSEKRKLIAAQYARKRPVSQPLRFPSNT